VNLEVVTVIWVTMKIDQITLEYASASD